MVTTGRGECWWFSGSKLRTAAGIHVFDFSPLCISKCELRTAAGIHVFDFSPVCIFKCSNMKLRTDGICHRRQPECTCVHQKLLAFITSVIFQLFRSVLQLYILYFKREKGHCLMHPWPPGAPNSLSLTYSPRTLHPLPLSKGALPS